MIAVEEKKPKVKGVRVKRAAVGDTPWESRDPPDPGKYFGFIYLITNLLTGKLYIGKKQYWMKKSKVVGCKSLSTTDKQSPHWKEKCWGQSDWKTYMGSSKDLTKDIKVLGVRNFTFQIIKQCRSRGTLFYSEVEEQVLRGCLWRQKEDGDFLFYNKQIAAVKFRPSAYYGEEGEGGCHGCCRV